MHPLDMQSLFYLMQTAGLDLTHSLPRKILLYHNDRLSLLQAVKSRRESLITLLGDVLVDWI